MRPTRLTLRNFIGIRNGLQRDELTLDLSAMRGLVALTGSNGMGKTTVLDNLHPYRLMPFRANGYSPRTFSYYEETFGDAYKELVWEHDGQTYRSEILIKGTTKTKKTEAYLYIQTPDGWAPLRLPDNTASDGKTDTYDRCVNHVLGSPEMFFTAVFCAQGRTQLADYAAGEMKDLLSELLGLDHLLKLSSEADEAAKYQHARFAGMQAALQRFEAAGADLANTESRIAESDATLKAAQERRVAAREAVQTATTALAEARAAASNVDDVRRRHQRVETGAAAARSERAQRVNAMNADIERARRDGRGDSIQSDIRALEAQKLRLTGRRTAVESKIAAAADPAIARAEVARCESAITSKESEAEAARAQVQDLRAAAGEVRVFEAQLVTAASNGKSLKEGLTVVQNAAKLAGEVPCAGLPINSECKLLQSAHSASATVPDLTQQVTAAREAYAVTATQRDAAREKAAGLSAAEATLIGIETAIRGLRAELRDWQAKIADAAAAEAAVGEIAAINAELAGANQQISEKQDALARAADDAEARVRQLTDQIAGIEQACTAKLAEIDAERATLPPMTEAGVDIAGCEAKARQADADLDAAERTIASSQTALATLNASKASCEDKMRGAEVAQREATELTEDVAQWRLLAKALGRDGVVALSIDDAGPTISGIANDLLMACYGPRFSVRFDTQAEKKDGSMKETFDIRVFDAEHDDDKSVSKTSGGERIWINDAITAGIGLFRAQVSGRQYLCRFSDEADGALDPERKQHYMRMKRRVMEIGRYETEFFISHTPELWALADDTLDFATLRASA